MEKGRAAQEPQWTGVQPWLSLPQLENFSLEGARVSEGDKLVRVGNPLLALVAINSLLVLHWEVAEGSGCVFSIYSTGRR